MWKVASANENEGPCRFDSGSDSWIAGDFVNPTALDRAIDLLEGENAWKCGDIAETARAPIELERCQHLMAEKEGVKAYHGRISNCVTA